MTVVTIISDYGWKDPYVAALKGNLLKEIENPNIIDITHDVAPFNLREAAHIINNSYTHFPKKSIHLLCVEEELKENGKMLVLKYAKQFFVSVDNGLFSLILGENKDFEVVEVDSVLIEDATTSREIFSKIAGHLSRGGQLSLLGRKAKDIKQFNLPKASLTNNNLTLIGGVMYIDHFGNAVTNISKQQFLDLKRGKTFEIVIPMVRRPLSKVYNSFGAVPDGALNVAVFNNSGWLEIAMYRPNHKLNNSAQSLLALVIDSKITVNFKA